MCYTGVKPAQPNNYFMHEKKSVNPLAYVVENDKEIQNILLEKQKTDKQNKSI